MNGGSWRVDRPQYHQSRLTSSPNSPIYIYFHGTLRCGHTRRLHFHVLNWPYLKPGVMQSYALRSERSFTKFFMHLNCDLHSPSLLTDQNKALSAHQGVHLSIHMPNCKPPAAVNNVLMRPVIFGTYQEKENYFTSQKNISSRKTLVIRQKAKLAANLFHFVHLLNQTFKTKTANLI